MTLRSSIVSRSTRHDRRPASDACATCSLTAIGSAFLEQAAVAARSDDAVRWDVVHCDRCGRVTAVVDLEDGSSFGEAIPHARLHLLAPGDGDAPLTHRDVVRLKRRRTHGWFSIVWAGVLTTVLAAAGFGGMLFIGTSNGAAPPREVVSDTTIADPAVAAPVSSTDVTAGSRQLHAVVGTSPARLRIADVGAIAHGTWVEAAARVTNTGRGAVAPTEVAFTVIDGAGEPVAEASAYVDLGAAQTKTVGIDHVDVEAIPVDAIVRVSIADAETSATSPTVVVGGIRMNVRHRDAVIRASVRNTMHEPAMVTVTCAVTSARGELTAVGLTALRVGADRVTAIRLPVRSALGGPDATSCSAS